jgi:hypothetical protein
MPSAFRDPKAKHRVWLRIWIFDRDTREAAPDETGKNFEAEAARDQEMLGVPGWLSRDKFEDAALVGRNAGRHGE